MNLLDVKLFSAIALINMACIYFYLRGFTLLSFDEMYAKALGFKTGWLKLFLSVLTVLTIAIGVQAVGVVLMAALLITPAAGARFLTSNIRKMLLYSGILGLLAGVCGAFISSSGSGMPTGPWVVIVLSILAIVAILFGRDKGLISRMRLRLQNKYKIENENVLKVLYRSSDDGKHPVTLVQLKENQQLSAPNLESIISRLKRNKLVELVKGQVVLSEEGMMASREVVRKHRLWELYLSKYFHLKADHLHDDAEGIEHVITPEIERHLTQLLEYPDKDPHESEIPY
jgi:manganese/zinc/iron transport system permease protein